MLDTSDLSATLRMIGEENLDVRTVTLGADEREPGGLGIYMVRKLMSETAYVRRGDWNELTVRIDTNRRR